MLSHASSLLALFSPGTFSVHFCSRHTATTGIYTLSLHDALPICRGVHRPDRRPARLPGEQPCHHRSEEHTSELQSPCKLVCRLLLEKKKQWRRKKRQERSPHLSKPYSMMIIKQTQSSEGQIHKTN